MTEKDKQKILTYFRNYDLNIEERAEFKDNPKILLEAAQETIRLLESYSEEDLKIEIIQKMLEWQIEEKIKLNRRMS